MKKLINSFSLVFLFVFSSIFVSCASNRQAREVVDAYYKSGDYEKVESVFEKENKDGDHIDFLIDEAMVKTIKGDYKGSVDIFNRAYLQMQKFTGEMSGFDQFQAGLLSEESVKYYGPAYEYSLLDSMSAYNFIKLGDFDSARAMMRRSLNNNKEAFNELKALQKEFEARSASSMNSESTISALQAFESVGEAIPVDELMSHDNNLSGENDYQLSPFIFYLGSLLFANDGDFDLANDWIVNVASRLDRETVDSIVNIPEGMGSINVVSLADNILRRREAVKNIIVFQDLIGIRVNFKLTWPYVPESENVVRDVYIKVRKSGSDEVVAKDKSVIVEDFDDAVRRDVKSKAGSAYNRSLLRNITRKSSAYVVGATAIGITLSEMSDNESALGMLIVMNSIIALQATLDALDAGEHADIRQGAFFPSKARAASVIVEPGLYDITVDYVNGNGRVVNREIISDVRVKAGVPTVVGSDYINTGNFNPVLFSDRF